MASDRKLDERSYSEILAEERARGAAARAWRGGGVPSTADGAVATADAEAPPRYRAAADACAALCRRHPAYRAGYAAMQAWHARHAAAVAADAMGVEGGYYPPCPHVALDSGRPAWWMGVEQADQERQHADGWRDGDMDARGALRLLPPYVLEALYLATRSGASVGATAAELLAVLAAAVGERDTREPRDGGSPVPAGDGAQAAARDQRRDESVFGIYWYVRSEARVLSDAWDPIDVRPGQHCYMLPGLGRWTTRSEVRAALNPTLMAWIDQKDVWPVRVTVCADGSVLEERYTAAALADDMRRTGDGVGAAVRCLVGEGKEGGGSR